MPGIPASRRGLPLPSGCRIRRRCGEPPDELTTVQSVEDAFTHRKGASWCQPWERTVSAKLKRPGTGWSLPEPGRLGLGRAGREIMGPDSSRDVSLPRPSVPLTLLRHGTKMTRLRILDPPGRFFPELPGGVHIGFRFFISVPRCLPAACVSGRGGRFRLPGSNAGLQLPHP
jgi:hypothetical protein